MIGKNRKIIDTKISFLLSFKIKIAGIVKKVIVGFNKKSKEIEKYIEAHSVSPSRDIHDEKMIKNLKKVCFVEGGLTRQETVYNCLKFIDENIHRKEMILREQENSQINIHMDKVENDDIETISSKVRSICLFSVIIISSDNCRL